MGSLSLLEHPGYDLVNSFAHFCCTQCVARSLCGRLLLGIQEGRSQEGGLAKRIDGGNDEDCVRTSARTYPFGLLRKANPADEPSKAWLLLGERRDVGHGHQRL